MLGKPNYRHSSGAKYGPGKMGKNVKDFNGMNARVFINKDSPDYKPSYGKQYTERQMMILREEIPLDQIRKNEICIIIRKAEAMGDEMTATAARIIYGKKTNEGRYQFSMGDEEARNALQSLTPWKIDWAGKGK